MAARDVITKIAVTAAMTVLILSLLAGLASGRDFTDVTIMAVIAFIVVIGIGWGVAALVDSGNSEPEPTMTSDAPIETVTQVDMIAPQQEPVLPEEVRISELPAEQETDFFNMDDLNKDEQSRFKQAFNDINEE